LDYFSLYCQPLITSEPMEENYAYPLNINYNGYSVNSWRGNEVIRIFSEDESIKVPATLV
jgi:hypothetical protein